MKPFGCAITETNIINDGKLPVQNFMDAITCLLFLEATEGHLIALCRAMSSQ
jgi:hypothetical protein